MLSASKDGTIYIWSILGDSANPDDRISYVADYNLNEPLTNVKWLSHSCLLATTIDGNLYSLELIKDSQNIDCFAPLPKIVYTTEHEVSIWDMALLNKAP